MLFRCFSSQTDVKPTLKMVGKRKSKLWSQWSPCQYLLLAKAQLDVSHVLSVSLCSCPSVWGRELFYYNRWRSAMSSRKPKKNIEPLCSKLHVKGMQIYFRYFKAFFLNFILRCIKYISRSKVVYNCYFLFSDTWIRCVGAQERVL